MNAEIIKQGRIVEDMGSRVVHNGGEVCYSSEKLFKALHAAARGLLACGVEPAEIHDALPGDCPTRVVAGHNFMNDVMPR